MNELPLTALGVVLTLLIFSYVLQDNPLYRLALHVFVGAAVGYAMGIAVDILISTIQNALQGTMLERSLVVVPLMLSFFLLLKGLRGSSRSGLLIGLGNTLGNFAVAFLVGVGAAVAIGGALLGTLITQVGAAGDIAGFPDSAPGIPILNGLLALIVTLFVLLAFNFTLRSRPEQRAGLGMRMLDGVGRIGSVLLIVVFAVAYAGVLTTGLSLLVGQVWELIDFALRMLGT